MPILKQYDKNFFKRWSSDMAYILGFLYADGNIVATKRGTHFVAIYSADKDILFAMKKCFGSDHKISIRKSDTGCVYRIQIGSKEWFDDLGKIGLFPKKTKRLVLPEVPKNYFGDFVRGYFDGDGNVWSGFIHKERKVQTKVIQVAFTSGAHEYLVSLRLKLQSLGIVGGSIYSPKKGTYSRFALSGKDTLKLYKIMYNVPHKLYLERKKRIFKEFVE